MNLCRKTIFEFDEESRTITAYVGTAVDVIIPRTIGGVPVEKYFLIMHLKIPEIMYIQIWETNQKEGDWGADALRDPAGDTEIN